MRDENRGRPLAVSRAERFAHALMRWPEVWIVVVPLVYLAGVLAPPLLTHAGHESIAGTVFPLFRGFCHQMPHRTLHIAGEPMAVCARCFALAAGLAATGIAVGRAWAFGHRVRVPAWAIALAAVPMALDGFSQLFGFRESTNTLRVLTGLLLGAAVSLWSVPTVLNAFDEIRGRGNET